MQSFLKVKIKSLAAEAAIIRREERQALKAGRWGVAHQKTEESEALFGEYNQLHNHRTHAVRDAARVALLAYGFLRGRPYRAIENEPASAPPAVRRLTANLAVKYGSTTKDAVLGWFEA